MTITITTIKLQLRITKHQPKTITMDIKCNKCFMRLKILFFHIFIWILKNLQFLMVSVNVKRIPKSAFFWFEIFLKFHQIFLVWWRIFIVTDQHKTICWPVTFPFFLKKVVASDVRVWPSESDRPSLTAHTWESYQLHILWNFHSSSIIRIWIMHEIGQIGMIHFLHFNHIWFQ